MHVDRPMARTNFDGTWPTVITQYGRGKMGFISFRKTEEETVPDTPNLTACNIGPACRCLAANATRDAPPATAVATTSSAASATNGAGSRVSDAPSPVFHVPPPSLPLVPRQLPRPSTSTSTSSKTTMANCKSGTILADLNLTEKTCCWIQIRRYHRGFIQWISASPTWPSTRMSSAC